MKFYQARAYLCLVKATLDLNLKPYDPDTNTLLLDQPINLPDSLVESFRFRVF